MFIPIPFRITFGSSSPDVPRNSAQRFNSNDNSVLINALAMKYLPCEINNTGDGSPKAIQIAPAQMTTPINVRTTAQEVTKTTPVPPLMTPAATVNGFMANRQNELDGKNLNTDMSITSYRYMEKYGLL